MVRRGLDMVVVGDMGATNCQVGVSSPHSLIDHEILPTPHDPDRFFHLLGSQILRFADYHKARMAAIAVAGPVRITNDGEQAGPLPNIAGMDEPFILSERLAAAHPRLSGFPLITLNDATAAAHATARYFADGNNSQPLTYLALKTGVGGDTIIDYETYSYTGKALSEYGQMPLRQPDGSYATLENLVSGRAIKRLYGGNERDATTLAKDPATQDAWDAVGRDLARGIGMLIPLIGMRQLIIGGGVGANAAGRYGAALHEELQRISRVLPPNIAELPKIQFLPPDLDQVIGLRGCYFAARKRLAGR